MFAIAVPSTVVLTTPPKGDGEPETFATLSFSHPTEDVSKCQLTLTTADGHVHEAVFNTQGGVVEQKFTSAEEIAERQAEEDKINEERAERDREAARAQSERELATADDTTAADVAWDAPSRGSGGTSAPHPRDPNVYLPDGQPVQPAPNPFFTEPVHG